MKGLGVQVVFIEEDKDHPVAIAKRDFETQRMAWVDIQYEMG